MAFIKKSRNIPQSSGGASTFSTPEALIAYAEANDITLEPLDIAKLTHSLGIVLRMEPMKGEESGSLKIDKKTGVWVITVNSLHHPNRQRFTIAHELGHYIKHSADSDSFEDKVFFRNGDVNVMETEANRFAAELLMPEKSFRQFINETSKLVSDIAEKYGVSAMAVRVRAKQLGYEGHNL